jgi:uncharacterized repeat protein (TIGR02543 family)
MNKKTIYRALILLALFTACDMSGGRSDWNPDRQAAVQVKINAEGIRGRTVMPSLALQDVTTWQLLGGKQGDAETLLDEFANSADAELTLDSAIWHFTLKGFKGGDLILTGSITEQNIILGTNILDFTVAPILEGQGSLNIVINLPAGSGITAARVFVDGVDLEYSITPTNEQIAFSAPYNAGIYYFSVRLYKDGVLYGAVSEVVHVWANLQSEKTYTLTSEDLNLTYVITYHFGDGGIDYGYYQYTDADKTLPPPTYTVADSVFRGWYDNPAFSGSAVSTIPAGSTGDKHFYAKWVVAEQVSSTLSFEESLDWIEGHAVEGGVYAITINENESIPPHTLYYSGKNVNVVLNGGTAERTVSLTTSGSLFTVASGVTLTLGNNVSLQGRNNNTTPLVQVNSGGTLVMNDGSKISGNSNTSGTGGGVYMNGGTFTMTGGTISGNTASNGGGVYATGTWTMSGGTISGNTAYNYGGGVYAYNTFMMSGGTISNNTAYYGGGVYASNTFMMSGGAISGNSVSNLGGGVYVESSSTFTMSGGAISGNTSSNYGGGVYAYGTFTLSGGAIGGNTAPTGGGVYAYGTFIKQAGGTIYGSTASDTLKNTATNGDHYGHAVYVYSNGSIRNSTAGFGVLLDSGATAGGWETFIPSNYSLTESLEWIANNGVEGGAYVVMVNNNESLGTWTLSYAKNMSIALHGVSAERTISLTTAGSLFTLGNGITLTLGNNVSLQGLSSNTSPLVRVNNGGALVMEGGSKLSGNGNTTSSGTAVAGNGGGAYIASGGVFTMNGGEISGNSARNGGGVYVVDGGTFTKRTDGIIYGSNASDSLKNTAANGGDYGHAVYVNSSSAKLRSATAGTGVTLDSAVSGSAGGWETLILSGLSLAEALTRIASNAEVGGFYTVTIENDETIAPTTLSYSVSNVSITLDGGNAERTVSLTSNGSLFTIASGVTLTLGNNVSLQGRSSNTDSLVYVNGGTLVMESGSKISGNSNTSGTGNGGGVHVASGGVFTMSGGTISGNTAYWNGSGVFVRGTFTQSGGTINGNTTTANGGGVMVYSNGTFTQSGGTISNNTAASYGGGVYVVGTFTQSGGTISGNNATANGGGVYISGGTFTKQAGGTIYGSNASDTLKNTATYGSNYGHAVYVDGSPEKLRNNTADLGVTLNSAISGSAGGWETQLPPGYSLAESLAWISTNAVEGGLYAVTITANETIAPTPLSYNGKSVSITLDGGTTERTVNLSTVGSLFTVGSGVTLTLEDIVLAGKSDNTAPLVKVETGGKLAVKTGGRITGNTYTTSVSGAGGAGVFVSGGELEISGGEISGNTLTGSTQGGHGGGVLVDNGSVVMTGGAIRENSITNVHSGDGGGDGGGIYITNNSSFEMLDGKIEGNILNSRSTSLGNGVSGLGVGVWNSYFHLGGGVIRNNTGTGQAANIYSTCWGGGVSIQSDVASTFIMNGGIISGNSIYSSTNPNSTYYSGHYRIGAFGGGVGIAEWSGSCTMIKTGGVIYGSDVSGNDADGYPLRNTAQSDGNGIGGGHAVWMDVMNSTTTYWRNATAYAANNMDRSQSGPAGGWENGVSNITYSSVSGSAEWTLDDGSRKSPTIGHSTTTKARISFTSTAGASITIQLTVSSESGYDFAFIGELDNQNAAYNSGYYQGSVISGGTSVIITIPISSSGNHFIDIGYRKDGSQIGGSDCAWFKVIQ